MRNWPPAFGQRVFRFLSRLSIVSLALAITACNTIEQSRTSQIETAQYSFRAVFDEAEDPVSAPPERSFFPDISAGGRVSDPEPAYDEASMAATKASFSGLTPRIVAPRKPLQCVPYARMASGIALRGDAHTWWKSAKGRFRRGHYPSPGAVMVIKGGGKTPLGHVAVVTKLLNEREILVDHANWLNNEKIHLATPVIDVSPANDWSAIRVWYTPGNQYGANVYPLAGFIYPDSPNLYITVANANVRARPTTAAARIATLPRRSRIEVLGRVPRAPWYRVRYDGKAIGYIYAKLVRPTS